MSWLLLAVAGHLSNGLAFLIDKTLLSTAFKRSATYAALISILSLAVAVVLPWTHLPPITLWPLLIGYGGLNAFALWSFFEALRGGETSRVVPITGSLVPLFTLAGTCLFLGERLTRGEGIGLALLLVATVLLSSGGRIRIERRTVGFAVLAAVLFATTFVLGKAAYLQADFWSVFVISRCFAGLAGVLILILDRRAWQDIRLLVSQASASRKTADGSNHILAKTIIGQVAGALGFILVNAAIADGSASLVNALQAVQYTFIVLIAWFGGSRLRALLKEERTPALVVLKTIAILCTAAGLGLIARGI